MNASFVVIGGGIAGVTCTETLAFLEPEQSIVLISESTLIKTVTNLHNITRTIVDFDVKEQEGNCLTNRYPNVSVIHDTLIKVDHANNTVYTQKHQITYKSVCLCLGAKPNIIPQALSNSQTNELIGLGDKVIGIRDTDSVELLQKQLKQSKTVAIVGNGGIASELVHKLDNIEIHWIIKDKHISATFVDPGAAHFFQNNLENTTNEPNLNNSVCIKRMRYNEEQFSKSGAALGPDWYQNLLIKGTNSKKNIHIHYEAEILNIHSQSASNGQITLKLSNNSIIVCDLLVSATGVLPTKVHTVPNSLELSQDGGILVNEYMQTNVPNIYAAGDVCTANWDLSRHWFQMRLWTQARQMGYYAAKCISAHHQKESILQDFCFELFAHSTKLFGYKVILLGLYNGQKLGTDYEVLLRMTKDKEYIKLVLQDNKLQGAVLIGDTDLEEMCENLILNQLNLEQFGDDLLNPDIDIEDYFD